MEGNHPRIQIMLMEQAEEVQTEEEDKDMVSRRHPVYSQAAGAAAVDIAREAKTFLKAHKAGMELLILCSTIKEVL